MKTLEQPRPSVSPETEHDDHQPDTAPPHRQDENVVPKDLPKPGIVSVLVMCVILVAMLAGLFVLGLIPHLDEAKQARSDADAAAQQTAAPMVSVIHPHLQKAAKDVFLPADVTPWARTSIYARSTGYLKEWKYDIGSRVKQGELLAVIDAPDVDAELNQAKATLEEAKASVIKGQADVANALSDYNRYLSANKANPGSVTPEDIDTKRDAYQDAVSAMGVYNATVAQDQAAVQQISVLQGFERIYAPFNGIITARNYDVGAYITPTSAAGSELFDIADTETLRVFVDVPQNYATQITIGQDAFLAVRNYPAREFKGTVARMTGALSETTRTLPFELDFPNSDGALYPGMYGQARIPVVNAQPLLIIPSSAMLFNANGIQVAVVKDGKAHFQKITIGRDLGVQLEITDGLSPDDFVITNPGERLLEGGAVQVSQPPTTAPATRGQ
jgi:membrane fusion protein (multidrug efflux system)